MHRTLRPGPVPNLPHQYKRQFTVCRLLWSYLRRNSERACPNPNFQVCFDTGYGSSKVPIAPYNFRNLGRIAEFNFDVPASTIQDVPPAKFVNGSFAVSIYSVPTNFTACGGNEGGAAQGNTVTLNLPILRSVTLPELPEQNASLKAREPSNLALTGANFISNSGTSGKATSAVRFTSSNTLAGAVRFISTSSLISTIPTTISATASQITVQVCNIATYSYCSNSLSLKTVALQQNPGTLIASPNPALTSQPVTLTATFGPAARSVAGAPSGLVSFSNSSTTLGTANLVLDGNASFALAPTQQIFTYAQPIPPLVADFNGDGIPDTLFIDPGTGNAGASLNLLLGTVPSGSFAANRAFNIQSGGPSFIIRSAATGDFNGDGIPDLALLALAKNPTAAETETIYTMLGNGDGTFQDGFVSSPALYGSSLVAGDFNKDGKQDLVLSGYLDAKRTIVGLEPLLGDGKGNFTVGPATGGLSTGQFPVNGEAKITPDFQIAASDLNADGYPDIIVLNGQNSAGTVDSSIEIYQNNGKGVFDKPVQIKTDGSNTARFIPAPLTESRAIDILVMSTKAQAISVFSNQSKTAAIAFSKTPIVTSVPSLSQVVAGDFNGDGLLDIAVEDPKSIHILSGNGEGIFAADYKALSIAPPGVARLIAASDENGDKYADLLLYTVGNQDGNTRYPITLYDYITAGTATATLPAATFSAGMHALKASTNGTFTILAGTVTTTLNVTEITPSILITSFPGSPQTYAGTTTTLIGSIFDNSQNPSGGSTATGTASFYNGKALVGTGPLVRTVDGAGDVNDAATLRLTSLSVGTYSFTVRYPGDASHEAATSRAITFQVVAGAPTITWKPDPATIPYGSPLTAGQLDALAIGITGKTVPGTFTYAPAVGTILTVGSHSIVATFKPTDANYTSKAATQNIVVTQAFPRLTWKPNPATILYGTALSTAQLDATSSTPGTFAYTPAAGVVLAAGTHTLSTTFTPNDTTDCSTVTKTVDIVVSSTTPTISWLPSPATIPYGTPLSDAQLDATSNVAGTFVYTPALGSVLNSGTQILTAVFTPRDTNDFKSVTTTTRIIVTSNNSVITWRPDPATIPYGTLLSGAQLDATSSVPGTFVYTPGIGALLAAGTHTLSALFTPTDTANFKSQTSAAIITITQLTPVLTWVPNPSDIAYGTPLSAAQLDATSGTPGSFVYTPALGTILPAGSHVLSVTFTPRDITNYAAVTRTANVLVGITQPVLTWTPNPSTITYGAGLSASQLNAIANTPGTFTYTPALGTVLDVGPHLLSVTFKPVDTTDFSSISKTVPITVDSAAPSVTWNPNPSTISYGTPLSAAQLDATSAMPGAYTYGPANGAILTADTQTLSLRFHPTDNNYSIVNLTRTITVAQARPTLTWATPGPINLGAALSSTQLDAVVTGVGGLTLAGRCTYTPPIGTVLPVGANTLTVLFTPTDSVDYTTATASVVQVVGLPATITRLATTINSSEYGQPVTLTATTLAGSKVATGTTNFFDGNTLIGSSTTSPATFTTSALVAGTHDIVATFVANDSFAGSTSTALAQKVSPATIQVTWTPGPATIAFGTPLSAAQLDATVATTYIKSVAGVFSYTPALGTVLDAGTQTLRARFTPADTRNFLAGSATSVITVTSIAPVVTWLPNPATITYGTPLSAAQLDATSVLPGAYTYSPASGAILTTGVHTLSLRFHPTDPNYNIATLTRVITVSPAGAVVTWLPNPAILTYGTPLSAAQLDATTSTPGTFTYTPATGTVLSAGTHTLSALFTPTDTVNYRPQTTTATVVVTQATPTLAWLPNPATISYGTPLSAAQLDATSNTPGSFTYTPAIGAVLGAGTQALSVFFTPTDGVNFKSVTANTSITVTGVSPVISWSPNPATIPYGTPLSAAQLDATSSTPGTFTYGPALGTVLPAGTQTLSVLFTPRDTINFKPLTSTTTVTVTQATPVLTWKTPAAISFGTPLSAAQLDATARGLSGAALPGTFTYTPALGTVLAAGTHTLSVLFIPAGATNYKTATSTVTLAVTASTALVTWLPNPATIAYGTPLSAAQLDATSATPGTFTYTPAFGTVLSAGPQTLSVRFTPTDATDFKTITATTTVTVLRAIPALTWTPPAAITFGTPLTARQLDATALGTNGLALPGTFSYTPAAGAVLSSGRQTLSVLFTPTDATDYQTATKTVPLTVTGANATVTWLPNPAMIAYGTPLSAAQLDATSTTPGTFVYTPALGTVLGAGTQTLSALFTPMDTTNFRPVTTTSTIVVTQATPVLMWATPAAITFGTPLSTTQLDASAASKSGTALPGTFSYTPAPGTVLSAGSNTLTVLFSPTDAVDFKAFTKTVTLAVAKATPSLTWTTPAAITSGTPLSTTQLDATAASASGTALAGTFIYTPAAGTVLPSGTSTLRVVFTPTDAADYTAAAATVIQSVNLLATTTGLSSSLPDTQFQQPVTLTATTTTSNSGPVTGVVNFYDGSTFLGETTKNPGSLTISTLSVGTHAISVVFISSKDFASSTSTTLTQTVSPAATSLLWTPNPATLAFGNALSAAQLDATVSTPYTSKVAGTFAYAPALGTILQAGVQTLSVTFTPANKIDYLPSTGTALLTVTGSTTPTITWTPVPATITYGTSLSAAQLDAIASTPGTFTYAPALGTVLGTGTHTLSVLFTPNDTIHFKSVNATTTVIVTQATPAITWQPNPATLTYGTALSAAQLDATATTPGTFAYTPAAGTVLTAGTQTLSVAFSPKDPTDFKSVTTTTTVIIKPATPTISWIPNPATIAHGTALSAAQLDATASTPGTFVYTPAAGTVLAPGTQTLSAVFTPKDATDFKAVTTTTAIAVTSGNPVVTWTPNPATISYGTALTAAQLDANSTTAGTFTYTPGLGTILNAGVQTLSAVFTPSDTTNFQPFTTTTTITVTAAVPTVSWTPNPAIIAYGTALSGAQLDATSTTAGTFIYTPALGTILAAGTHSVSALFTPTNTTNFKPVTMTVSITVTALTPTVTWAPTAATIPYGTPLSAAQLDATSTTPGTFSYTPALGTVLAAGTQTLTAVFIPKDTANYKAITSTITIVVTAATPTITWTPNPATIAFGTALSAAQLDATSTAPGSFVYTPALGTVLSAGTQNLSAVFTPTNTTDFKPVAATTTITVTTGSPTISWTPNPVTITYGTPLSVAQLDATSTTPGTFVYTPALGTVLSAGTQTLSAVFTPTNTLNSKPITTTATISVTASIPAITWLPNPASIVYGSALSGAQLDATSSTPGTFAYTPALGTVLTAGPQTLSVTFTPTDNKDFKALTTSTVITVTTATPDGSWLPNPAAIPYGTALSTAQLDATANTPGTFAYTPALGTVLAAGRQTLSATFSPTDAKDFKSFTITAVINVQQIAPTIVWPTPASIVAGTALSGAQLDATVTGANSAALPGTFTYTPGVGTLLPAGAQTLKVAFTPSDLADYTSATATVTLQVIPLSLTALSTIQAALGDPAKTITLTGTGFVSTAVVQVNGNAIPTTFVNMTTLTATIPASDFLVAQILQISVAEIAQNQATTSIAFLVGAPLANAVFEGPTTIAPGTDTDLTFKLTNPYPVDLAATFTVSFTPIAGLPNDPGVLFTNGSTTYAVVIPANSIGSPSVAVQGSTVAGSMTVTLTLRAGGVDVTPPTIQPLVIQAPLAVPEARSATVTHSGNVLTVVIRGLSNPRDMTLAKFHFTAVPGGSIGTPDITIDVVPIFTTWYADPASLQYGSTFTYTQSFNLSSDASVVGQVSVALTNSVGESQEADTP